VISYGDISDDEDLGRRVLVRARAIAPCLDSLDRERENDAIAILKGVVAEIPTAGSRRVRSRSRNGVSVTYSDIGSAFTTDDIAALRSLCSGEAAATGSVGSFPTARPYGRLWPDSERYP